jgi:phosphonate transport system permease protein
MSDTAWKTTPTSPREWQFPQPFGLRSAAFLLLAMLILVVTGRNAELDRAVVLSGQAIAAGLRLKSDSHVTQGFSAILSRMFPPQISETTETARIAHFDRSNLPAFSHLENQQQALKTLDPETLGLKTTFETREVIVEPFGYLVHVLAKLFETLEIALWGTLLAVVIGAPLAFLSARNLARTPLIVVPSRAVVSLFRAVPELISALFFVLAYGFGPIAGCWR